MKQELRRIQMVCNIYFLILLSEYYFLHIRFRYNQKVFDLYDQSNFTTYKWYVQKYKIKTRYTVF